MQYHTLRVSDDTYQRLIDKASRFQTTPEKIIERLLSDDLLVFPDLDGHEVQDVDISEDTTQALAAVQRLTTLFSDVTIDGLEQILDDPLLELENLGLANELQ